MLWCLCMAVRNIVYIALMVLVFRPLAIMVTVRVYLLCGGRMCAYMRNRICARDRDSM